MAICRKCMTGYDSSLQQCPKCNSIYRPQTNRINPSTIGIFFFFLLLGIGVSISASIVYFSLSSSSLSIESAIALISVNSILKLIGVILCSYTIFWCYEYAHKCGDSGYWQAFAIAIFPIIGLILLLQPILGLDLLFTGLYFGSIWWSFIDASNRGKPGCLVALLVAMMPVMGLISWLIFRP